MYNIVLFVHILAAVFWIGGTGTLQLLTLRHKGDADALQLISRDSEWVGIRVLTPIAVVLLIAGGSMAYMGPYGFSEPFVIVGLIGYALSIGGGASLGFFGSRMDKAIDEHGPDSPEAHAWAGRLTIVGRILLLILLTVVFLMITKPGTTVVA